MKSFSNKCLGIDHVYIQPKRFANNKKKRFPVLTKVLKYYLGICMSLAASLTLGLTAGCICRLAMFMLSSLQCLILTHVLPPVLST